MPEPETTEHETAAQWGEAVKADVLATLAHSEAAVDDHAGDRIDLGLALQQVEEAIKEMRAVADYIGQAIIQVTPYGTPKDECVLPTGAVINIGGGGKRTRFDQAAVASQIAATLSALEPEAKVVTADGEARDLAAVVDDVVGLMAEATGATAPSFRGWRAGVAKRLGIDLNAYCDRETAPLTVYLTGTG